MYTVGIFLGDTCYQHRWRLFECGSKCQVLNYESCSLVLGSFFCQIRDAQKEKAKKPKEGERENRNKPTRREREESWGKKWSFLKSQIHCTIQVIFLHGLKV